MFLFSESSVIHVFSVFQVLCVFSVLCFFKKKKKSGTKGLFDSYFLKQFYVLKNKENKKNRENTFAFQLF